MDGERRNNSIFANLTVSIITTFKIGLKARCSFMNKYEIETEILKELELFLPKIKNLPFDKGLPLLQNEAWRLADKYDTDGANVINIMMKRFGEIRNE